MPTDTVVRARVDQQFKAEASEAFEAMGLSMPDAIRLLLVRVAEDKPLPLVIEVPNAATASTFDATDRGEDIIHCGDTEKMFDKLGI
jgi:DNA-damage-inducible protein J